MIWDCQALREAIRGCRLLLLAATELEAAPVLAGFRAAERLEVAAKQVYVGTMPSSMGREVQAVLGISGCDKVNPAVLLTALLQATSPAPDLVLQFGIAGAFAVTKGGATVGAAAAPRVGDLVVVTQEAYSDTGSSSPQGWLSAGDLGLPIVDIGGTESGGVLPLDADSVEWAVRVLSEAWAGETASSEGPEVPAVLSGPCVTSSTVTGRDDEARRIAKRWGALAESMEGAAAAHVCALYGARFLEIRGISNLVGDRSRGTWQIERAVTVAGKAVAYLADAFARESDD